MRKFIITSPAFTGQAEILFRQTGTLAKIDCTNTNMDSLLMRSFKARCPEHIDLIEQAFAGTQATVVEADFDVTFDMFWQAYNKKINKKRCEPIWDKMRKDQQVKAWMGIAKYDRFLKNTTRGKLDPENYLRNEAWENEWR